MESHGVSCIKGEIHSIMTLMRLHSRWSQLNRFSRESAYQEEDSMVLSFRKLNVYLEGLFDLKDVDCVMYIVPFYNVIVSDKASGPLTSAALSSLCKFTLYGFLTPGFPRVQEGIALISRCTSLCVFEETDWESDELILMKLLELSTLCYRCEASKLLTIASAWDMFATCISIHNHYRASKILKSEAENALVHLTLSAFGRAQFALKIPNNEVFQGGFQAGDAAAAGKVVANEPSSGTEIANSSMYLLSSQGNGQYSLIPGIESIAPSIEELETSISQQLESVKGKNWDTIKQHFDLSSAVGITLLLGKILSTLSEMLDGNKQSPETVKFSLQMINVALEAGGAALSHLAPLVDICANDVSRHLLHASQSEDLAILSAALRVMLNLFSCLKNHMKVQLEVFLVSVHLRLISVNNCISHITTANAAGSAAVAAAAAKEELALESLLELCREPALVHDLYANYDCDVHCSNLFDSVVTTLCNRAVPTLLHQMGRTTYGRKSYGHHSAIGADVGVGSGNGGVGCVPASPGGAAIGGQSISGSGSSASLFAMASPPSRSNSLTGSSSAMGAHASAAAALSGGLLAVDPRLQPFGVGGMAAGVGGSGKEYVRLSIVNRLALEGVLAVLRTISIHCSTIASASGTNPLEETGAVDVRERNGTDAECSVATVAAHGGEVKQEAESVHCSKQAQEGMSEAELEDAEVAVDRWCRSDSTSPTADILSSNEEEEEEGTITARGGIEGSGFSFPSRSSAQHSNNAITGVPPAATDASLTDTDGHSEASRGRSDSEGAGDADTSMRGQGQGQFGPPIEGCHGDVVELTRTRYVEVILLLCGV